MNNALIATLALLCIAITYIVGRQHKSLFSALSRSKNCQRAPKYPSVDPIFGLDLFFANGKARSGNRWLPTVQKRYEQLGWTFESLSFGIRVINSIEPENLKTAWVVNFEDWGVQSNRLPSMEPFVGRGFLTADGANWEHSRALLKPSLRKAHIANLEPFESSLRQMISKIPKDGSTIDLQTLIFDLVSYE
jgi:hypothetical protein